MNASVYGYVISCFYVCIRARVCAVCMCMSVLVYMCVFVYLFASMCMFIIYMDGFVPVHTNKQ